MVFSCFGKDAVAVAEPHAPKLIKQDIAALRGQLQGSIKAYGEEVRAMGTVAAAILVCNA